MNGSYASTAVNETRSAMSLAEIHKTMSESNVRLRATLEQCGGLIARLKTTIHGSGPTTRLAGEAIAAPTSLGDLSCEQSRLLDAIGMAMESMGTILG